MQKIMQIKESLTSGNQIEYQVKIYNKQGDLNQNKSTDNKSQIKTNK